MTYDDAEALYRAIREEFPGRFLIAIFNDSRGRESVSRWGLRIKERGSGPHNPRGSLFKGPPVWVRQAEEWPDIARKRFGIKVVGV